MKMWGALLSALTASAGCLGKEEGEGEGGESSAEKLTVRKILDTLWLCLFSDRFFFFNLNLVLLFFSFFFLGEKFALLLNLRSHSFQKNPLWLLSMTWRSSKILLLLFS